jgi:hypothetical protein
LPKLPPGKDELGQNITGSEGCEYLHILTVATDPMKSNKAGWLDGELKTPK